MMQTKTHIQLRARFLRYTRRVFVLRHLLIPAFIACLILVMINGERKNENFKGIVVKTITINAIRLDELKKILEGEFAFDSLALERQITNRQFRAEGPARGGKSNHIILSIPPLSQHSNNSVLYVPRFYASKVWVYNHEGELLHTDTRSFTLRKGESCLAEAYIQFDPSGMFIVLEAAKEDRSIGISRYTSIMSSGKGIENMTEKGYPRRVVGFFLLITALLLFCIRPLFRNKNLKKTVSSMAMFFSIFGSWIMLDFSRYDLWILNQFADIPPFLLVYVYYISSSFLNYGFANLCSNLIVFARFKKALGFLSLYAATLGLLSIIAYTLLLFFWNGTVIMFVNAVEWTSNITIIAGSSLLLFFSFIDALKGNRIALIFSIGFGVCEITFIVSQTTSLLISHWGVVVLMISFAVILTMSFNKTSNENKRKTIEVKKKNTELLRLYNDLEGAQHEILYLLGNAVDLRSKETSNHVKRVAEFTKLIAMELGHTEAEAELIALASSLHDIGKVGISDLILNKSGKLTAAEFNIMKSHSQMGYDMLNNSELEIIKTGALIALNHHERYDGTGYPRGLAGESIHPNGRIVAAADVLDALLNSRVYKEPWNAEKIITYFREQRSLQFEPAVSDIIVGKFTAFEKIHERMSEEHAV